MHPRPTQDGLSIFMTQTPCAIHVFALGICATSERLTSMPST